MLYILQTALVFSLILGTLIVIHEFGHFLVARLFGIRVETFSIGFGKRIMGWKKGYTDYRISLIPLGGYVKMAGESDSGCSGASYEFMSKPKWQRFLVALAGPAMNIVLALILPTALAMISNEEPAYLSGPAVIHDVDPDSPAERAGIRRGDVIVNAGGMAISQWQAVEDFMAMRPGQAVDLLVERDGALTPVALNVEDDQNIGYSGLRPDIGAGARLVIDSVLPGSPAARAGLQPGDRLLAINGENIEQSYYGRSQSLRLIRSSLNARLTVGVLRGDIEYYIEVTPRLQDGIPRIGIHQTVEGIEMADARLSLTAALGQSIKANLRVLAVTCTAIKQVFSGARSFRETFAGPLQLFKYSGDAADRGPETVVKLMSVLSLNLGAFNLLPVPVLDGGMIFMLMLEGFFAALGHPLSLRFKERMTQIGMVLLILLTSFVLLNDVSRLITSQSVRPESGATAPDSR